MFITPNGDLSDLGLTQGVSYEVHNEGDSHYVVVNDHGEAVSVPKYVCSQVG